MHSTCQSPYNDTLASKVAIKVPEHKAHIHVAAARAGVSVRGTVWLRIGLLS